MSSGPGELRVIRAGHLLHADGTSLSDAGLAWRGDEILACGPWRAMRRAIGDANWEGGADAVLVPGLVNAHQHGHGLSSLVGGVLDQPLEGWLAEGLGIPVPPDRVSILAAAARLIRSGVTTAVHLHACRRPADPERLVARLDAYRESGLNVALASGFKSRHRFALVEDAAFLAGIDVRLRDEIEARFGGLPAHDYLPAADWASAIRQLAARIGADDRVRLLAGPPGPEWVRPEDLESMAALAGELGLAVQVHVAESPLQARLAEELPGSAGLAAVRQSGLLGPRTSLVHAIHLDRPALESVAEAAAMVVTCPGSNLRLRHGVASVVAMRHLGIDVALGTDSLALGDRDDLWTEARLALALHGGRGEAPGLGVADAWSMLTVAGARAADMPRSGRLEPGARADFVLLHGPALVEPAGAWLADPASLVLGRARPQDVRLVVAAGREILRDGRILAFDEDAVLQEAAEAVARGRREAPAAMRLAQRLAAAVAAAHRDRFGAGP